MRKFIRFLTYLLSYVIPVDNKLLLFVSYPDFGDNSYAVFKYLINSGKFNHYNYCWLIDHEESKIDIANKLKEWGHNSTNIAIVKRKSFHGIVKSFRALYIFNTVGLFTNIVFHQNTKRINLWHGMPIKRIYSEHKNGDITICTGHFFKKFMSEGLNIPEKNVLVLGQPRNDLLYHPEDLCEELNIKLRGFNKVGIWMPTFRRSDIDKQYSDGIHESDKITVLPFSKLYELNSFLKERKTLLIIKFHPMDVLQYKQNEKYSNILFLKNSNFKQNNLYPLLGSCDFLISDYSSVVIDFEILGRPIGITTNDLEEYKNSRGLNMDEIPGYDIPDYNVFLSFIDGCTSGTITPPNYANSFNLYKDDCSTKRLIEYLGI